jgi:hypothetical protein
VVHTVGDMILLMIATGAGLRDSDIRRTNKIIRRYYW